MPMTPSSTISTRWSYNTCTKAAGRHLSMDEGTSPTAQPG